MDEHYYTKSPESKLVIKKIKFNNKEFYSASGLFSLNKVDNGTELLIKKCQVNGKVLDLGCGYGIIGLILKLTNPELELVFSDVNERAVKITKKNLGVYNLKCKTIQSNSFENIKEEFNVILLNPPQTAGKKLCFKLIEDSYYF